ncbi:energy transducer TonB [Fulvivirga lutea]|uniref:Energy transducer TonB n=1 Tax=Fulvivirga lutea TaxID=2810512 RepID=A0A975A1F3_9BACT|nr:energy transducer TonB [Fulvivirga lutea]QSE98185.1 energy transducer TonB [Fulvivirga lutea]
MEKRKNPEKELRNKQGLFFNMGLLIALTLCVAAFEYEVEEKIVHVPELEVDKVDIYLPPITEHKIPEPPKPKLKMPDPTRVKAAPPDPKDFEPLLEPKKDESPTDLLGEPRYLEDIPEDDLPEVPFDWVEEMPKPKGGYEAFYQFISKHLKYPALARRMGISGKISAQFVVDEKGNLIDIQILKGIGAGCDEEVLRLLEKAPKWNPGKQRGVPVKVKTILPIEFRLD